MLKKGLTCVSATALFALSSTFSVQASADEVNKYVPVEGSDVSVIGANTDSSGGETEAQLKAGDSFRIEGPAGTKVNLLGDSNFLEVVKPGGEVGLYAVAPAGLEFEVEDTVVTVVDLPSNQVAERAAAESNDEPIRAAFGLSLIDRVDIVKQPEGTRYKVFPTVLGRAMRSPIPETTGWNEAKSKGVADTGSLHNQFVCHPLSQVARVKSSWNLEDWRPDVGLPRTIAERCNLGGGDD